MRHARSDHRAVLPARSARHVETFVLDVHRPFKYWNYYPAQDGQPERFEATEVQPGTYPVRVQTNHDGEQLAVVDLDTVITRRTTLVWRILPRTERPYTRAVTDTAWAADDVADSLPAMTNDDGTPLATWRRLDTEEVAR